MSYSQRDPRWADTALGSDSSDPNNPNYGTIGQYGCYITSVANVSKWGGNDQNPAQVNQYCIDNNLFVSSDLLAADDVPARLAPQLTYTGKQAWSGPTPMEYFADASDPNVAYIVRIQTPTVKSHFSMVWSTAGPDDLIIDDSWDGVRKRLSLYGVPSVIIIEATKFIKITPSAPVEVPAPIETPVVPTPEPAPVVETPQIAPETVVSITSKPEVVAISTTPPTTNQTIVVAKSVTPKITPLNKILAILKMLYIKIIGV